MTKWSTGLTAGRKKEIQVRMYSRTASPHRINSVFWT